MQLSNPIGIALKEKFPNATSVFGMVTVGLALIVAGATLTLLTSTSYHFLKVVSTPLLYVGIILIVFWAIILIIEFITLFVPTFKVVMKPILFIPRLLLKIYTALVKFVIRTAVTEILQSKRRLGDQFVLLKRKNGDDDYWDQTLDIKNLSSALFRIKPDDKTDYWRFGVKFSDSRFFKNDRSSVNQPLFHVTKDANDNTLKVHYYDKNSQPCNYPNNNVIIDTYKHEEVSLLLDHKNAKLHVRVMNKNDTVIFEELFDIDDHAYGRILAWGDGHDFKIAVEYSIQ